MSRSDLSKDDLFQALKHFQGSEYDMFTGNCGIFAYALQQYLGAGTLIEEHYDEDLKTMPDHVLLEWRGVYWDADGWQTEYELDLHQELRETDMIYRLNTHDYDVHEFMFLLAEGLGEVVELDNGVERINPRGTENFVYRKGNGYVEAENRDSINFQTFIERFE